MTVTRKISESQFWQLYGLVTAKLNLDKKEMALYESWKELTNKEGAERFWDFYLEDVPVDELKSKLKFDGIEIKK